MMTMKFATMNRDATENALWTRAPTIDARASTTSPVVVRSTRSLARERVIDHAHAMSSPTLHQAKQ